MGNSSVRDKLAIGAALVAAPFLIPVAVGAGAVGTAAGTGAALGGTGAVAGGTGAALGGTGAVAGGMSMAAPETLAALGGSSIVPQTAAVPGLMSMATPAQLATAANAGATPGFLAKLGTSAKNAFTDPKNLLTMAMTGDPSSAVMDTTVGATGSSPQQTQQTGEKTTASTDATPLGRLKSKWMEDPSFRRGALSGLASVMKEGGDYDTAGALGLGLEGYLRGTAEGDAMAMQRASREAQINEQKAKEDKYNRDYAAAIELINNKAVPVAAREPLSIGARQDPGGTIDFINREYVAPKEGGDVPFAQYQATARQLVENHITDPTERGAYLTQIESDPKAVIKGVSDKVHPGREIDFIQVASPVDGTVKSVAAVKAGDEYLDYDTKKRIPGGHIVGKAPSKVETTEMPYTPKTREAERKDLQNKVSAIETLSREAKALEEHINENPDSVTTVAGFASAINSLNVELGAAYRQLVPDDAKGENAQLKDTALYKEELGAFDPMFDRLQGTAEARALTKSRIMSMVQNAAALNSENGKVTNARVKEAMVEIGSVSSDPKVVMTALTDYVRRQMASAATYLENSPLVVLGNDEYATQAMAKLRQTVDSYARGRNTTPPPRPPLLTSEQLAALPPDQRAAIERQMKDYIEFSKRNK